MSEPAVITIEQDTANKTLFGFWTYMMTDCVLFTSLFATYAVLHNNTFGGPAGADIFKLPYVLGETLILLTSSFTCGLAILSAQARRKQQVLVWLGVTFALGVAFLAMELSEFHHLAVTDSSWRVSGFLSSYFTLVGTHGLHIATGLLWMAVVMQRLWKRGLTTATARRLTMLGLFWHFLDIVWIFIFTIVYLLGAARV